MPLYIRNREELEHLVITMHAEGWKIRALARHFAMGRNTIRRIIRQNRRQRDEGHDLVGQRKPVLRKSKLDAFRPLIKALLKEYPDITGVRVYEELVANGFDGGRTIVTDYLRKIRPRPKKEPVVRFETEPGHQGQMDWSPYTLPFTRTGRAPLELFLEQEQSALTALPVHAYDTAEVALRVCRVDGFLEHETNPEARGR